MNKTRHFLLKEKVDKTFFIVPKTRLNQIEPSVPDGSQLVRIIYEEALAFFRKWHTIIYSLSTRIYFYLCKQLKRSHYFVNYECV